MNLFDEAAEMGTNDGIIAKLAGLTMTDNVRTDQIAQIRSFCGNFERFSQSPRFILTVIQPEFHFKYVLNLYKFRAFHAMSELRKCENWPDRLFVLVDHRALEQWVPVLVQHAKKSFICALMPVRVETNVFHEYIMRYAKEVRFLKGKTVITKEDLPADEIKDYTSNYALVLFSNCPDYTPTAAKSKYSAISLHTSFLSEAEDRIDLTEDTQDEEMGRVEE